MNPKTNPLAKLLSSSKALVVLAVTVASFVGLYLGKAQWSEVENFLKWMIPAWLFAAGAEDAAKHLAAPRFEANRLAAEERKSNRPPPV
jgi:hypothetical protein